MEYHHLLLKADLDEDPVMRIIYVALFNLAQYSCTENRLSKPFNPLLGETFELNSPDYRFLSEQVSHHPPISACYAESTNKEYKYWMNTNVKTNFWGASLQIVTIGWAHVCLPRRKEMYSL